MYEIGKGFAPYCEASLPSRPATVFGREGLGHEEQGVTHKFRSYIRNLLSDFAKGSSLKDLAFSPEFSREQRAEIHM